MTKMFQPSDLFQIHDLVVINEVKQYDIKNPEYDFFGKGSKAVGPVS